MKTDTQAHRVSAIYNACWWIRNYNRPAKKIERKASILALGLVIRSAFAETDDFEPLLEAIVSGLDQGGFGGS